MEIFSSHIKSSKFPSNCLSWTNYLNFEYNITALHIDRNEIEIKSTFVIQLHFRLMFPFFHSALYIFFPLFFSFYFSYVTLSRKYFMLPCKQFFSPSLLPVMYHCQDLSPFFPLFSVYHFIIIGFDFLLHHMRGNL